MPASNACCAAHVTPLSSEYERNRLWNDCSIVTLQPVGFCTGSAAIQATKIRPACGVPGGAIATPAGTVLQKVSAPTTTAVVGSPWTAVASTGWAGEKVAPPSCEMLTQISLGP